MRKKLFITVLACIVGCTVYAQSAFVVTGGDISNSNGTINYSIGQVFFTTEESPQLSLAAGLQSPYEVLIEIPTGIQDEGINLSILSYPNPVKNILTLDVRNVDLSTSIYVFSVFNLLGNIVSTEKITESKTEIDLSGLPSSSYILRVMRGNELMKSFVIIKN